MNLHEMRDFISKAYPGQAWKNRVKKMGENQIIAIYYSMMNREKTQREIYVGFDEAAVCKDRSYEQLTLFDILKGERDNE